MRPMRSAAVKLAATCLWLGLATAGGAQDVRLTSRDGDLTLDGTMLGFDGEFYRIDSIYGTLTLDASGVNCAGPGCPDLDAFVAEVTVSGAESMGAVLMPALVEAFAAERGLTADHGPRDALGFTYTISGGGGRVLARIGFRLTTTDEGFADLLAGEADLAMAAREVGPEELARGREAGIGSLSAPAQSRIVAYDAFVVAVAPDNPLVAVAPETLAQVLAGQITDWGALGGPAEAPIRLHALKAELGAEQGIEAALLVPAGLRLASGAVLHDDAAGLAEAVAEDRLAIGVTLASALGPARAVPLAGSCGFRLKPDDAAIRSEDYPLVAPLFLYAPARRLPAIARDFLAFLSTPSAERVIRRAGFTDLGVRRVPLAAQGDRLGKAVLAAGDEVPLGVLQRMVRALDGAARLSPTFRFRTGAAGLDASSRGNAIRLSEALEAGVHDGQELIFVGFSDGEGGADANLRIAQSRAETVMRAVRALSGAADFSRVRLSAMAFGEALPMACDDSDWGRQVNRRVEVWVR